MYLRHTICKKDGKVHRYWTLVPSVRVGRRVIQQAVAQLGELDERGRIEARALARRLIGAPEEAPLFDDGNQHLTTPVRLKVVRVERSRRFGDVYVALALWRGLGLEELCRVLLPIGQERVAWAKMAAVLVTARLCEPSSELHIAEDWYRRTALCDLLQLGDEEVNKDRLYRALDRLLAHKAALEAHLSERCGQLFAVDNDVLLYDVTSTYFEGQAEANPQAQRGYSRDHRPDCAQVCIALVVTFDGFPLGYEVFAGNTHDSRRLKTIVAAMEARHGALGRVWIADRGMASAENLAWLRETGRRYVIGAPKSELKKFRSELARRDGWRGARRRRGQAGAPSRDRRNRHPVPLGRPAQQRAGDARQVQPADRAGAQAPLRPRRALEETARSGGGQSADWTHPATKPARRRPLRHRAYARRLPGWLPPQRRLRLRVRRLRRAAFRIQKDRLNLRPIWHQREDRVQAHILVCFLAFALWKSRLDLRGNGRARDSLDIQIHRASAIERGPRGKLTQPRNQV